MAQAQSQTCVVCGTKLRVHERVRGNVCADAECRRASVRRQLQARREALEQTLRAAARWRRQFPGPPSALDTDAGAPGADTVLLPVNTRPLGPLPERRRRRFRDYFTRSLGVAAARNAGPADETAAPGELAHPFSPVADGATHAMLGEACATCRGHCCAQGGEHAFQRPEILSAYLLRHPHLRPRDVLAAYLDHLPTTSYQGSCVFHTRNGCGLPVAMRSPNCRDYLCDALWGIVRGQRDGGPAQVFGVAVEDATPVRAGVIRRPSAAPRTGPRGG